MCAQGKAPSGRTTIIRYNWMLAGQLSSERVARELSTEAQELCEGYSVFMLELLQDRVAVLGGSGCHRLTKPVLV